MPQDADPHRSDESDLRKAKLYRLSIWARGFAGLTMFLVIVYAAYLPFDRGMLLTYLTREVPGAIVTPPDETLWLAYLLSMIPAAFFMASMWKARQLFGILGHGRIFDPRIPVILVRLGQLAIAIALSTIVVRTLVVLAVTSVNPPGQRQLVIGLGTTEIGAVVAGILFFAFALVMGEALRVDAEYREIV